MEKPESNRIILKHLLIIAVFTLIVGGALALMILFITGNAQVFG